MTTPNNKAKSESRSTSIRPRAYSYVRFSSPEQAKGDSLRRQIELAEQYAETHGLDLDTELTFRDLGVSAFHGDNAKVGELRAFLTAVENGTVVRGSVLLVESLDRISRETGRKGLRLLEDITDAGVEVGTMSDGKRYSAESLDEGFGIIEAWLVFKRGHEESAIKSMRLAEAWKRKRKDAASTGKKMTKQGPAWLCLSKDRSHFKVLPEAAEAVRMIFELRADGYGKETIARKLNEDPTVWKPPPRSKKRNPKGGWQPSVVERYSKDLRVLGQLQAHKTVDGKRRPEGDPLQDYYPTIIDKNLFHRVQSILATKASLPGHGGGKTGNVGNVFGDVITRCGFCGGTMRYQNKGKPPKGGQYLVCSNAKRGMGCDGESKRQAVRYDRLENVLLHFIKGLDPQDLVPGADERKAAEARKRRTGQQVIDGELLQLKTEIKNLSTRIAKTSNTEVQEHLDTELAARLARKKELEQQQKELTVAVQPRTRKEVAEKINSVEGLIERINAPGKSRNELRRRLKHELQQLIKRIEIEPMGEKTRVTLHSRDGAWCTLSIDDKGLGMSTRWRTQRGGQMVYFDDDGNIIDEGPDDDNPGGGTKSKPKKGARRERAKMHQALKRQGLSPKGKPHIAGTDCGLPQQRSREHVLAAPGL